MRWRRVPLVLLAVLAGVAAAAAEESTPMSFALRSSAFADGQPMPRVYTCEGADRSPPLAWSGTPAGTRSFALILTDPDAPDPAAPRTTWVHWVLYDLPADTTALAEGADPARLPAGTRAGTNDWKRTGYGGPCPPIGRHRYVHQLFALDTLLGDLGAPTRAALERAMAGHVLATASLVGTYQKAGR